ncbi:transglycosylase [Salmonella enterica]|nr:transglycosylase [Salmonella enterica subsp. enterica]EAA2699921.1 transglycosylase [Salmonella enterica]EAA8036408.1 transglycosylase [Salmonella enterica subsp. enterica serovar Duisburg]EAQ4379597.1 transglycosylase [Salmonella enterica subsp. enterica serovar Javiana]EBL5123948.1 transglycosylase [Salmonella enterica subsp. enterica serovar Rubislaw]ECH8185439.1 transglycosylase [Salmonella enterica subsp. enterica serovar Rissen]ECL7195423.1 transglycosylase [Salmonella enterica subsp
MLLKINQQNFNFAWGVVLLVVRTANLLSMELEWVKLLPDDYARGKINV